MRFSFTEEQIEFRDAVHDFLAKECTPERLREAWSNGTGRVPGLWAQLADMGVVGMLAPEANGGLAMNEVDLVLILEETGRVALPEPVVETAAVAVPWLVAREHRRLDDIVKGTATATVTGVPVELAAYADVARVFLHTNGTEITPTDMRRHPSVDGSRRLFQLAHAGYETVTVATVRQGELIVDRGALGTAAQLLGLADRMIEMTVEYVKERKQFGVPVGSFQAVKHHLANARLALEFARPLVYRAAYSIAHEDPDRATHVSMAKANASDAAQTAARVALQCHGAIGYTTEYDLHLFLKRTWSLARAWGDPAWHRRRIEAVLLGGTHA